MAMASVTIWSQVDKGEVAPAVPSISYSGSAWTLGTGWSESVPSLDSSKDTYTLLVIADDGSGSWVVTAGLPILAGSFGFQYSDTGAADAWSSAFGTGTKFVRVPHPSEGFSPPVPVIGKIEPDDVMKAPTLGGLPLAGNNQTVRKNNLGNWQGFNLRGTNNSLQSMLTAGPMMIQMGSAAVTINSGTDWFANTISFGYTFGSVSGAAAFVSLGQASYYDIRVHSISNTSVQFNAKRRADSSNPSVSIALNWIAWGAS